MPKPKQCPYQLIIAIDQLFNVICLGWADETFSARCWRQRNKNKFWYYMRIIVDILFFWDYKIYKGNKLTHCALAYDNELDYTRHKPKEYNINEKS